MGLTALAGGAANAQAPAAAAAWPPTTDWTIGDLIANPATKAVLQADLPELLAYDGLDNIKGYSLKAVAQYAPDKIPQAKVDQIQADLAKLPAPK
jgi:para-nitrobenzyl esterase